MGTKYIYIKAGDIPQIADAISRANSDPSYNHVLLVPPGAYTLPAPVPPSTSTFTVIGNVVIQGVNANYDHDQSAVVTFERLTYLSLSYRMFFVAPGASLTLRDIRLKGGGGTSGIGYGGTIYNYGQLSLIDVRVTDGSAYAQGGGIYNIYPGSTVLTNVMFKDNAANVGGAISNFSGDVDIYSGGGTYCIKFKNNTGWVNGGAVYSENADTKVSKGIFTGNTSPVYRDIENSPVSPPGNVVKAKNSWWLSAPSVSLNIDTTGASIGGGEPDMNCSAATPADVPSANWSEYGLVFGATQGNDIFETLEGVKKVGLTLMFKFGGDTPWDAFKRIMYFSGRTQIRFERGSVGQACVTNNNVTAPLQAVITCNTATVVREYTFVHELGHVFIGRTGGTNVVDPNTNPPNQSSFYGYTRSITILDNSTPQQVVFGSFDRGTQWGRGTRGWGSSAALVSANEACRFQQNPLSQPGITVGEIDEGGADMFLNWIYRKRDAGGFINVNWPSSPCLLSGPADFFPSGDSRNSWMNSTMTALGAARGW